MFALVSLMSLISQVSGTPYIPGGDTPAGTDCSGLASWVANVASGRPAFGSRFNTGNIEPALLAGEPLGGHYVQGHVDGVGTVRSVTPEGDGVRIGFTVPADLLRYVAFKGSITIEGVSLTVAALDATGLEVALIPHTLEATTLGGLVVGDPVNLEVDVLAKYVERMTSVTASSTPSAS